MDLALEAVWIERRNVFTEQVGISDLISLFSLLDRRINFLLRGFDVALGQSVSVNFLVIQVLFKQAEQAFLDFSGRFARHTR